MEVTRKIKNGRTIFVNTDPATVNKMTHMQYAVNDVIWREIAYRSMNTSEKCSCCHQAIHNDFVRICRNVCDYIAFTYGTCPAGAD